MKFQNKLSLLFVLLLTVSSSVACGDTQTPPSDTNNATLNTSPVSEDAEPSVYDNVPTGDFGGYEFRILNNISNFAYTSMDTAEETGEPLDDAIYKRNRTLEEKLNIKIRVDDMEYQKDVNTVNAFVAAGDDQYDIVYNEIGFLNAHAQKGQLLPLEDIENLHLDAPWWNQSANTSMRIGEHIFYAFGDANVMYSECFVCCAFNKTLLSRYDLDDPYSLVKNGIWTIDKMGAAMREAAVDIDGDGKMTYTDEYGLAVWTHNTIAFLSSTDITLIPRSDTYMPSWQGLTEDIYNKLSHIRETIFPGKDIVANGSIPGAKDAENSIHDMFHDGRILFYVEPLGSLKKFRDVDFEFGVVPVPKYEEAQATYKTAIFNGASALTIPVTNSDVERTAVISENLAAASHESVKNAYFDVTLDFKYIQDKEGGEMLDIIFANGQLELSRVFNWGNIGAIVCDYFFAKNNDLASSIAKKENKIKSEIEETITVFETLQ